MPFDWIQPALNVLWFVIIIASEFISKLDTISQIWA